MKRTEERPVEINEKYYDGFWGEPSMEFYRMVR